MTLQPNLTGIMLVAKWVGVVHIISGICILLEPSAIMVSSFAGIKWVTTLYAPAESLSGFMLIAVGTAAIIGGTRSVPIFTATRLKLIGPQVILLVFTLASVLCTMAEGRYPDGYIPDGGTLFIVADQSLAAVVSLFHVLEVLLLSPQTVHQDSTTWG